jgi:hypothetical protein
LSGLIAEGVPLNVQALKQSPGLGFKGPVCSFRKIWVAPPLFGHSQGVDLGAVCTNRIVKIDARLAIHDEDDLFALPSVLTGCARFKVLEPLQKIQKARRRRRGQVVDSVSEVQPTLCASISAVQGSLCWLKAFLSLDSIL